MTQAIVLRCRPESQFHFGRTALDVNSSLHDTSEYLHSDTLFSALVSIAAKFSTQDELDALYDLFENGQVRMSSGFYCIEDETKHNDSRFLYFLPKPAHYLLHEDSDFKAAANIRFISKGLWESGIKPGSSDWDKELTETIQFQFKLLKEEAEVLPIRYFEDIERLYSVITLPRVDARIPGNENGFYFLSNLILHQLPKPLSVHFYFLLETEGTCEASAAYSLLKTAINMLADCGIGGEISGGCGRIEEVVWTEFELASFPSEAFTSVSMSLPADQQDLDKFLYYKTMLRGGRKTPPDGQVNQVRMIAEGAYLTAKANGIIVDLAEPDKSDKPYWRSGKAFALPVHKETTVHP